MQTLTIVITSTREGRIGGTIAEWFTALARRHGKFAVELVDLKQLALPPLHEPNHPRKQQYLADHTKAWSATVAASDAFVFVVPEYNFSMPPAMLNALDYLYAEWNYKPASFVSYGGVSGGLRSVQMAKQALTALNMMPIVEAVALPFAAKQIDAQGVFVASESAERSATAMLDELVRWAAALATLRS